MILSDGEIIKKSKKKKTPLIEPFNEKCVTPNGYDLRIERMEIDDKKVSATNGGTLLIPPNTGFAVLTQEKVTMPSNVMARMNIKTKYARMGIVLSPGAIDAGFIGQLNLFFHNLEGKTVEIKDKATIAQIVFEKMDHRAKQLYAKRSGNYQNQDKIIK